MEKQEDFLFTGMNDDPTGGEEKMPMTAKVVRVARHMPSNFGIDVDVEVTYNGRLYFAPFFTMDGSDKSHQLKGFEFPKEVVRKMKQVVKATTESFRKAEEDRAKINGQPNLPGIIPPTPRPRHPR